LPGREAVDAVHEVVEVGDADEPDDGERCRQPTKWHIEGRRERQPIRAADQHHDGDSGRQLDGEPVSSTDGVPVIDRAEGGDHRGARQEYA
jgi:hypothetical protein